MEKTLVVSNRSAVAACFIHSDLDWKLAYGHYTAHVRFPKCTLWQRDMDHFPKLELIRDTRLTSKARTPSEVTITQEHGTIIRPGEHQRCPGLYSCTTVIFASEIDFANECGQIAAPAIPPICALCYQRYLVLDIIYGGNLSGERLNGNWQIIVLRYNIWARAR